VAQPDAGRVVVSVNGRMRAPSCAQQITWTILGSGDVLVATSLQPGNDAVPELPRFGMQTTLRAGFDRLVWYGKGPQETYWDRQDARSASIEAR